MLTHQTTILTSDDYIYLSRSLEDIVSEFALLHGEHNIITLSDATIADIVQESRSPPFLSDARLLVIRYHSSLKPSSDASAYSDEQDTPKTPKSPKTRSKSKSLPQEGDVTTSPSPSLSDIPEWNRIVIASSSRSLPKEIGVFFGDHADLRSRSGISRDELHHQIKMLLPSLASGVIRYLDIFPPDEALSLVEYFHLGYSHDASSLTISEIDQVFPRGSEIRSYEALDFLLSGDREGFTRIWIEIESQDLLYSILPTMRTQLRKYIAALHLLDAGYKKDMDGSIAGVKRYPIDKLLSRGHSRVSLASMLSNINDIQRQMITGGGVGPTSDYIYLRLLNSYRQDES